MPVFFIQSGNRHVQQRGDLKPLFIFRFVQLGLHLRLLFTQRAAALGSQGRSCGITGRAVQPAWNNRVGAERTRLARQNNEHGLRHVFGQMRVAHLPHRRRINKIDMAGHQRLKRLLGLADDIVPQQFHVLIHHSLYTWPPNRRANSLFCSRRDPSDGYNVSKLSTDPNGP